MPVATNGATIEPPIVQPPPKPNTPVPLEFVPADQLNGMEEFGTMRNWVSFDAQRGKFVCRSLNFEAEEFMGSVLESRVVRVMKDEDGNVLCASSDRITADE